MLLLSWLHTFQKSILVRGLQKDGKKRTLQSISRPMVDSTCNLLHFTFSPWTSTQIKTQKQRFLLHTQTHTHTQEK